MEGGIVKYGDAVWRRWKQPRTEELPAELIEDARGVLRATGWLCDFEIWEMDQNELKQIVEAAEAHRRMREDVSSIEFTGDFAARREGRRSPIWDEVMK